MNFFFIFNFYCVRAWHLIIKREKIQTLIDFITFQHPLRNIKFDFNFVNQSINIFVIRHSKMCCSIRIIVHEHFFFFFCLNGNVTNDAFIHWTNGNINYGGGNMPYIKICKLFLAKPFEFGINEALSFLVIILTGSSLLFAFSE